MLTSRYRSLVLDKANESVLIADLRGTAQEKDLAKAPNCGGFGRIRHFKRRQNRSWPEDPLPMDPACKALGLPRTDVMEAQVFQCAVCNVRCWYCFVPDELLCGDTNHASMLTAPELVRLYLDEPGRPLIIDLSGGNPELVPEWPLWMMRALCSSGMGSRVYLWSDDNLSTDCYWSCLSSHEREQIEGYVNYGRVCCFKGFDERSFTFNTGLSGSLFGSQFDLFARLLTTPLDLYAYVTFTALPRASLKEDIARFVDRLQGLDCNLPLRTVPLEIRCFEPVHNRMNSERESALRSQYDAAQCWQHELEARFSKEDRSASIADVPLRDKA